MFIVLGIVFAIVGMLGFIKYRQIMTAMSQ